MVEQELLLMKTPVLQMQQGVISSQPHLGSLYGTPSGMQSPGPHQSNFYGSGIPGSGIYRFFFRLRNVARSAVDSLTLNQPTMLMEQYYCTLKHVLNMNFVCFCFEIHYKQLWTLKHHTEICNLSKISIHSCLMYKVHVIFYLFIY